MPGPRSPGNERLLGDARFAADLFSGMRGMNRLFQGSPSSIRSCAAT
jgi:hypothetical protein